MYKRQKYGKDVRTVEISNGSKFSYELCGGTHCERTGEIGSFYIVSETSIASGVRRIEAVTGKNADDYAKKSFSIVKKLSNELNTKPEEISEKINFLNQTIKNLRKELSSSSNSIEIIEKIISSASKINGYDTIFNNIENLDPKKLRDTSELLKTKYEGIIILTSVYEEKINLVISIPKIYSNKFNANEMVRSLSKIIGLSLIHI